MAYTLSLGDRTLNPPSMYALSLMDDFGVSLEDGVTEDNIARILAAMFSDSEPFVNGCAAREWTAEEAAAALQLKDSVFVLGVVAEMIYDALPVIKSEGESSGADRTWMQASMSYALALADVGYTHADILKMTPRHVYRLWLALPDPDLTSQPAADPVTLPTF